MAIYKLGDIASVISGGTPSTKNTLYWNGEIPWITPKDLSNFNGVYIGKGERSITKNGLDNSGAKLLPKNCLLFSSRAPIGYVAISNNELCTNQGFQNLICNETIANYKYLFYWLKQNKYSFERISTGATFKELSKATMKQVEVNLPSLKHQQEIIDIIKPIEGAINNLNKQIDKVKAILIKQYESSTNIKVPFTNFIEQHLNSYDGQSKYLATNAIGEFTIDISKKQNLKNERPSRANLTPVENSIIISKLDGENKILYIDKNFEYVLSTGFFNFTSKNLDHVVGFLLSNDFKRQKKALSTGTTMIALNNVGLKKIQISNSTKNSNNFVKTLNTLIRSKIELEKELNKIIRLLIK